MLDSAVLGDGLGLPQRLDGSGWQMTHAVVWEETAQM